MIQISNINKSFNKRCVLKNISFDIEQGKCIALIGKNGAGKSTLIDILIGNVNANSGEIFDKDKLLIETHLTIKIFLTLTIELHSLQHLYKNVQP